MPLQKTMALLVEDDMDLAETVADYLSCEGIDCEMAFNGQAGLEQALNTDCDVILLDITMPGMNGLDVCRNLRDSGSDRPILMITARDTLSDKLEGFEAGADDYLVKPFALEELVARVKALRGRRSAQSKVLKVHNLVLDLNQKTAKRGNRDLRLSPKTWAILQKLTLASPGIVSRAELERYVWGEDCPYSDALKYHIHKLRFELDRPYEEPLLQTIPKTGFALRLNEA